MSDVEFLPCSFFWHFCPYNIIIYLSGKHMLKYTHMVIRARACKVCVLTKYVTIKCDD